MKRIDSPNRSLALFGTGKDGFKQAIPGVSSATELTAKWFNGVQEAIIRTIEGAGIVLSEADYDQFTAALQWYAAQASLNRVTQGGGAGQIAGLVKIGAAAGGKLKAEIAGVDFGAIASEGWTNQLFTNLIGAAPTTLDQINELASAIGNDPNFSVTLATALAGKERKFDSGTLMLFQQTAAPVGWTKVTTHNNKALRIVSGAVGTGGTVDFTTAFVNGSVGATALTTLQIPSHTHSLTVPTYTETGIGVIASGGIATFDGNVALNTAATGNGDTHTHTINLDVKYVDIIIASKD